jgi:hypothetical protein
MQALIELGKTGQMNVAYGVVATLVNLSNSYDKQVSVSSYSELWIRIRINLSCWIRIQEGKNDPQM